jgi:hypothetical protein
MLPRRQLVGSLKRSSDVDATPFSISARFSLALASRHRRSLAERETFGDERNTEGE